MPARRNTSLKGNLLLRRCTQRLSLSSSLPWPPARWIIGRQPSTDLLGSVLQTSYSQALYGAANLVDIDSLKVIYLSLLPNASVKLIGKLGLCPHHSRHPSLPFYYPHHVAANGMQSHDPLDTVWIARAAMPPRYQARPIANHSWVEVTHCSSGVIGRGHESLNATNTRAHGDPGIVLRRAIGPAWFYVAPGSGVSINVGRTIVLTMNAAKRALNDIAKGDTHTRARGCRPPLQLASSSSNNSAGLNNIGRGKRSCLASALCRRAVASRMLSASLTMMMTRRRGGRWIRLDPDTRAQGVLLD